MLNPALGGQSLARTLTPAEAALATALECVFTDGTHDFSAVAAALQAQGVARPSGNTDPWTVAALTSELSAINRTLDDAYARNGIGA